MQNAGAALTRSHSRSIRSLGFLKSLLKNVPIHEREMISKKELEKDQTFFLWKQWTLGKLQDFILTSGPNSSNSKTAIQI